MFVASCSPEARETSGNKSQKAADTAVDTSTAPSDTGTSNRAPGDTYSRRELEPDTNRRTDIADTAPSSDALKKRDGASSRDAGDVGGDSGPYCECFDPNAPCCDGCRLIGPSRICDAAVRMTCGKSRIRIRSGGPKRCGDYIDKVTYVQRCSGESAKCTGRVEEAKREHWDYCDGRQQCFGDPGSPDCRVVSECS